MEERFETAGFARRQQTIVARIRQENLRHPSRPERRLSRLMDTRNYFARGLPKTPKQ